MAAVTRPPSALDLARPALVPLLAVLVDRIPVDHLELAHLLGTVGNAFAFLGRQLHHLVDRTEPGAVRQHGLGIRAEEILEEGLRFGLVGPAGDGAARDAERDTAL